MNLCYPVEKRREFVHMPSFEPVNLSVVPCRVQKEIHSCSFIWRKASLLPYNPVLRCRVQKVWHWFLSPQPILQNSEEEITHPGRPGNAHYPTERGRTVIFIFLSWLQWEKYLSPEFSGPRRHFPVLSKPFGALRKFKGRTWQCMLVPRTDLSRFSLFIYPTPPLVNIPSVNCSVFPPPPPVSKSYQNPT